MHIVRRDKSQIKKNDSLVPSLPAKIEKFRFWQGDWVLGKKLFKNRNQTFFRSALVVNKQLQYTYYPISHELKTTRR